MHIYAYDMAHKYCIYCICIIGINSQEQQPTTTDDSQNNIENNNESIEYA